MDSSSHVKIPFDRHPSRPSRLHQVIEDEIRHLLMKVALVSEGPEVEFQAFELHTKLIRDITNAKRGKIRLARPRANAGEFRAIERDLVIPVRIRITESLQLFGRLGRHKIYYTQ